MTVTIGEKKITTPEELLAIGESPAALKKKYILEADIDLSGAVAGSFAVPGTFSGELDGNGFTLSGLNAVLFEKLDGQGGLYKAQRPFARHPFKAAGVL